MLPGRDRARPARAASASRATPTRPDRDFGAGVVKRQRDQLRRSLRGLAKEGFRKVHVLHGVEEVDAATHRPRAAAQRLPRPARPVRRDRRRARLPVGAGDPARPTLGYALRPRRPRTAGRRRTTPRAARGLPRRPRRPRPRLPRRAAAGDGHGRGRPRALRARQPREQARPRARRPQGAASATASSDDARAARRRGPPAFRAAGRGLLRRPGLAPRPRRRPAGRRARRPQGGLPRPGVGPGAQLRAVRRHDRRDRRVRPAGALPVGRRLPRPGDGALRAHADARAGVGQQHALPRHRLRVRRAPDRAALPGEGDRLGARPSGSGTSRCKPFPSPATTWPPSATPDQLDLERRAGQAGRRDRAPRPGHDPRGERRRRARGDEPVRAAPALAAVPAADDGAGRDLAPRRTCSSTPTRRSRRTPTLGVTHVSARRSTWARAPSCSSAATRRRTALRRDRRRDRRGLHPDRPLVLRPPTDRGAARPASAPPSTRRRAVGRARHRLAAARRRAAAVVGQGRATCCASSTPPSGAAARSRAAGRRRGPGAGAGAAASTSPTCSERTRDAGRRRRGVHRGLPPLLLADRRARRRAARAVPGARHARVARATTATTAGTSTLADRLVAADAGPASGPTRRLVVDTADAGVRRRPASRWWEELTAERRRGHGRQAARQPDPRPRRGWRSRA